MKPYFFLSEEDHKGFFLILSFILGIIIYFSLPFEPGLISVISLFLFAFLMLFFFFFKQRFKFLSGLFFFLVLGIFVSKVHTNMIETKFLKSPKENVSVTGTVTFIEEYETLLRVTLEDVLIESHEEKIHLNKAKMWAQKKLIRDKKFLNQDFECENLNLLKEISDMRGLEKKSKKISTDTCIFKRPAPAQLKKGDLIKGRSFALRPPSTPSQSGGYYEARFLYFEGIEAVGSFSNVMILKESLKPVSVLDSFKTYLKNRISFLTPETKGVVQALLIGDRNLITAPIDFLYRALGLTHILSVSGFHVGLISFLIYYLVRFILTLLFINVSISPFLIRNISASFALIGSLFYVLLTGAEPPAVRAFIMTGFIFLCFFINRQTLSVRTIFVAAFLLLCYKPVLILSAGFQLSFIAVLALCVAVKKVNKKVNFCLRRKPFLRFITGLFLLNVLVTFISLPFIAYHFHKIPLYGIIGNLVLSFVFSLAVMPLLLLGVLFMPFNMDKAFFMAAEQMLMLVHSVGAKIAELPYLMVPVPSFSTWGLVVFAFGFILLACMKGRIKYIGLILMILFPVSFFTYPKADLKLAKEGRLLAVREQTGDLRLNESYLHKNISNNWLLSNAQMPEFYQESEPFRPDYLIIKNKKISFDPDSCSDADLTFALRKKDYSKCPHLITKERLKQSGVLEVFVKNGTLFMIDFSQTDKNRPWNQKKKESDLLF